MVNDLLDDNLCLILLQSFDDASTMELSSFAWGNKVFILAKKYTCINNIPMHTKSRKVIYQDFHQTNFNFVNHMDAFIGISNWIDVVFLANFVLSCKCLEQARGIIQVSKVWLIG
jgi:hypothetical protein